MPRKLREEAEGAIHHVYARGNDKCVIFRDDADRVRYLAGLAAAVSEFGWRCLSYCLMTNHVHLLVQTPSANLGHGMRRLHGDYGRHFNRRHDRAGHLFQGRYGATRVLNDQQLWANVTYIALNPVAAGLCATAEAWPWSSHSATVTGSGPPWLADAELMAYATAAAGSGDPRRLYAELVAGRRTP